MEVKKCAFPSLSTCRLLMRLKVRPADVSVVTVPGADQCSGKVDVLTLDRTRVLIRPLAVSHG